MSEPGGDLSIHAVTKTFAANGPAFEVLSDVSLDVREGEFVSIVGASGCGKSTFLRVIAGLETADRGTVRLGGSLVNRPRVLLLDEPFGALDALTRIQLQHELLRIRDVERITMLLVTHDIDEAILLGDRVAVMSRTPGRFQRLVNVDVPRPRSRSSYEFVKLRRSIYAEFFAEAEEPFAYSI